LETGSRTAKTTDPAIDTWQFGRLARSHVDVLRAEVLWSFIFISLAVHFQAHTPLTMSAFTVTASLASRVASAASTTAPRRAVVVKAGGFTPDKTVGTEPVVFFTDKNGDAKRGTEAEYVAARDSQETYRASTVTGVLPGWAAGAIADSTINYTIQQAFAFKAPEGHVRGTVSGPELMNGRLAMVAFVSAAGAELSSAETVSQQFADAPVAVLFTISSIIFGSLISYQANTEPTAVGPFTAEKEVLNGRCAMVGMGSLLAFETLKHVALL
tara:strand:+ start:69 stop:878 length:810 start_codon:yes stop_codon:yes gene_type:complete